MELVDSILVTLVAIPSAVGVVFLYRRARSLFYLDKEDRFAAAKKKTTGKSQILSFNETTTNDKNEAGGRLSEIVSGLDNRNDSFYSRKSGLRRSVSWDATQSAQMMDTDTSSTPLSAIGRRWAFFKKSQQNSTKNPVRSSGNDL